MRKTIFFILLFSIFSPQLYSLSLSSDNQLTQQGNDIKCPAPDFNESNEFAYRLNHRIFPLIKRHYATNAPLTLYVCPDIIKNHNKQYYSVLSSIDGYTYTCKYYDKDSYTKSLTCVYTSKPVEQAVNKIYQALQYGEYQNIITGLKTNSTYLGLKDNPQDVKEKITSLKDSTFDELLKDYKLLDDIKNKKIKTTTPPGMKKLLNQIDTNIVNKVKTDSDIRHYTFAELMGNIITLNEHVVKGMNKINMSLIINQVWINKLTTVGVWDSRNLIQKVKDEITYKLGWIKNLIAKYITHTKQVKVITPASNSKFKIASLTDVFKAPIWGYYYLLMSYFDYLVNKVAILLMLVVGGYIGVLSLSKGFINSKLNPQGEFGGQTQSAKYSKLITSMSLIVFFLLSPATKQQVHTLNGNGSETQTVFYTNDTIAKNVIRQLVNVGNFAGTLTNDLGLSAYLYYFTRKEGIVNNLNDYKTALDGSVKRLYQLKYNSAILADCEREYNKHSLQDFFTENGKKFVYYPGRKLPSNEIKRYTSEDHIAYPLCQSIAKEMMQIPRSEKANIEYISKLLKTLTSTNEDNSNKIKALEQVMSTMILLNDKMGWISVMMVPVTDKIMKIANFYALLMPDNKTSEQNNMQNMETFFKNNAHNKNHDKVDKDNFIIREAITKMMGNMAIYMVLPGFSDIFDKTTKMVSGIIKGGAFLLKLIPIIGNNPVINKILKIGGVVGGFIVGFMLAVYLWNLSIQIIFSVVVSLLILFKIIFYFKDVLMYFVTSIFIPLLSFSRDVQHRVNKFLLDGLFLAVYPMIFVAMCYLFIFALELFQFLYDLIFKAFAYEEINVVETLATYHSGFLDNMKAFMVAESILTAGNVISILFELIIAYFMLFKGVSWVLSKLGFDDLAKNEQMTEQLIERGMKNVNPAV